MNMKWVCGASLVGLILVVQPALSASHATAGSAAMAAEQVVIKDPAALVRSTADQVLAEVTKQRDELRQSPQKIYSLVDDIVLPRFDFERMAQLVLGKHWRRASDAEKLAFVQAFRELLIRTYATALLSYSGQEIVYLPFRMVEGAEQVTVNTKVRAAGAVAVPIDYDLHQVAGDWKVFDVAIDGVSLVSNYRSSFASKIRRYQLAGLIKQLQKHNKRD